MYIKGFRVKFASYRKFGSKWIRGSVSSDALLKATFPSQVVWCAQWDPSSQPANQLTKMLQLEMKRHTFSFLLFASVCYENEKEVN